MPFHAGESLVLRPWFESDVEAVLAAFVTPDMDQQWRQPVRTLTVAREWLAWAVALHNRESGYGFAVCGTDDVPVGNIAVTNINHHDCGWISYWTSARVRGRGIAPDALRGLLPWLHDELRLHRLELGYRSNNPGSGRVAHKAGFLPEGRQRDKLCYDGKRYDVERCARLSNDPRPQPSRPVTVKLDWLLGLVVGVDDRGAQRHPHAEAAEQQPGGLVGAFLDQPGDGLGP
ncbi:GCN5-related N-acetyltransferase [Stackebrandtia nassauensis DSM 44728]|uniref:GCN5-related N-acetyltransferase n=1 Tax=Stackebrandtia nassauensis (strain DSM 44728 / CIP 108903 / NRRL B-16338 / NBRC 102104 / LLR-40K-21) TaxID=446470 RepID=D3Q3Y6_STANL|nr:GCN5-related N-acetyltransferase [Stackebrandtia nassauensis DSM 44728]